MEKSDLLLKSPIMVITTTDQPGGGEIAALALAGHLKEAGCTVEFLAPAGAILERAFQAGLACHEMPCWKKQRKQWIQRLMSLASGSSGPVILAESPGALKGAWTARLKMRFQGRKKVDLPLLVFHAHGRRNLLSTLTLGLMADSIVTVSGQLLRRYRHCSSRVSMIPNGATALQRCGPADSAEKQRVRAELGLPVSGFIAGFAGRLSPEKGVLELLEAWKMAGLQGTLALVGARLFTSKVQAAEAVSRENGSSGIVHLGQLSTPEAMEKFYDSLDLLILPSRDEQCPLTVIEAMGRGIPVMATGVGEIPGLLGQDRGILIPINNPAGLAEALEKAWNSQNELAMMGSKSLEFAKKRLQGKIWAENFLNHFRDLS